MFTLNSGSNPFERIEHGSILSRNEPSDIPGTIHIVETRDGRTIFGHLESEAPNSLTLRDSSSRPHTILRADVVSMSASKSSLMPNELERGLSEQDLADPIAYRTRDPEAR